MVQIIPAILAVSENEYQDKLDEIEKSGLFEDSWVQIDLMDNKFVQNKSIGVEVIKKYPTTLKLEAQLMVEYPENWIDDLVKIPVQRIIFPIEDTAGIKERIQQIKNQGIQVGLSVNPETPIEKIKEFMGTIDVVLIMSVEPGFGGQEFISESLEKIKKCVELRSESSLDFLIEVDGGVDETVAPDLVESGVDNLVVGSHLLKGNIEENVEKFWEAIKT